MKRVKDCIGIKFCPIPFDVNENMLSTHLSRLNSSHLHEINCLLKILPREETLTAFHELCRDVSLTLIYLQCI